MCITRIGSTRVSRNERVSGKPDAKSLGTDSKNTIHSVCTTSSKYPGRERTIAWKNTSQKSSSAKSLRCKVRGSVTTRRLKDKSDAPEARHGTLSTTYTSPKKKTKLQFYSPAEEWVLRLRQQKSRRKESLCLIPERVCIWSASQTLTLLSWRPRGHRGVLRRGANKRRSHGICQRIGLIRDSDLRIIRCSWSDNEFLHFIFTCFFNIFIAGSVIGTENQAERPVAWISRNRKHK